MKAHKPIGIDLFAGAGGMSLGFEQAGFDIAAAVEYDPIHCATHEFNFPNCAVSCRNIADITGKHIRDSSRIGNAKVEVVFGGPPCQGFSMIGKRAFDDPRNSLVHHFVRLVLELKSSYFVFENVRGLTVGAHKRFLEEIIGEFSKQGYRVLEGYRVLNAAQYGVPQNRHRLFLIGARKGLPLPEYPEPTHEVAENGKGHRRLPFLPVTPKVWDALRDLPEADDYEEHFIETGCKQGSISQASMALPCDVSRRTNPTIPSCGNSIPPYLRQVCGRSIRNYPRSAF